MTANINAKTGIAFGYISADAIDSEIVDELLYGSGLVNLTYKAQLEEFLAEQRQIYAYSPIGSNPRYDSSGEFDAEWASEDFNDGIYQAADEEVIEGIYQGVSYCSSFLGGALNFWILESPVVTDKARRASPCVPNAAILDTLDGNVTGYDVPADWRRDAN